MTHDQGSGSSRVHCRVFVWPATSTREHCRNLVVNCVMCNCVMCGMSVRVSGCRSRLAACLALLQAKQAPTHTQVASARLVAVCMLDTVISELDAAQTQPSPLMRTPARVHVPCQVPSSHRVCTTVLCHSLCSTNTHTHAGSRRVRTAFNQRHQHCPSIATCSRPLCCVHSVVTTHTHMKSQVHKTQ
jgi:hypothetical protein